MNDLAPSQSNTTTRPCKPDPEVWHTIARRRGIAPGPAWWHVSAYADYDLTVANGIGLTTVFVARPHARPGPAMHQVSDLLALATTLRSQKGSPE